MSDDPREAALARLAASRARLDIALAPRPRDAGALQAARFAARRLLRLGRQLGADLGGADLAPLARRHPWMTVGLAALAGAGLYAARGWLLAAGLLQLRRWTAQGQAQLVNHLLETLTRMAKEVSRPEAASAAADRPAPPQAPAKP